jgi:P-type Mg2+ transporter
MRRKKKIDTDLQIEKIQKELQYFSIINANKVLLKLDTTRRGLTEEEVESRQDEYGFNKIEAQKPPAWYAVLWLSFKTPFNIILILLMVVSYMTSDMETVTVMAIMVSISTLLRFWQELKALLEAESLKKMVHNTATVNRLIIKDNRKVSSQFELPMEELVPGDIIHLSAGDMVPGDVRLIDAKDLFVSQSALTGEAIPVEKHESFKMLQAATPIENFSDKDRRIKFNEQTPENKKFFSLDQPSICFMGSSIVSGTARAVIIATGNNTYFGSMATKLLGKRPETAFDQGVDKVSKLLVKFMIVMVPIVFLVNGLLKGDWTDAFLFSISVAVGLTPEMLPMIVNTNLARGAIAMAKKKAIVKHLSAIQNFGAIDVLCTDKTGTLTQDKVVLIKHLDSHGEESDRILRQAFLNSYFQTGLNNLLDKAVISKAKTKDIYTLTDNYKLIDEIPFDFVRRRMSVILERKSDKKRIFYCKGAVEEILENCTSFEETGGIYKPLNEENFGKIIGLKDRLSEDGLRVVAVAYKVIDDWEEDKFSVKDEEDLVFSGFIAFLDPPKETTSEALSLLQKQGITVKVLTGDNALVARKICKDVDLPVGNIVTGPEVDSMSDEELSKVVETTTIFAKLSPMHKAKIVNVLQKNGHIVGFMGDGINDALALRESDVGISVDTGVDLAKEAADIILLEKSLLILEQGVIEGRITFGNIIKYIKMTSSSNFGNVFSILIASAFLPFLPMLPAQLLIQNLLYDISQISIPWDKMDKEFISIPRKWTTDSIAKFMIFIGPISSIFDIVTFLVMWFVFKANCNARQSLFQTGWFVVGLLTQTLIVHMIRTEKIPFIQSSAAFPVISLTAVIMAVGVALPYTALGAGLGLVPLPLAYFPWLVGILLSYCILIQICKTIYMKKFKSWL